MVVGCDGDTAAQMGDDEPQGVIGLSQLLRGLAGGAFLVQRVEKALPLHSGAAGDTRQVRQLVHADRVDEKRRQPCRAGQPVGQDDAEICRVLPVGRMVNIRQDPVGDPVGPGGDMAQQPAPGADGVKLLQAEAALL